MLKTRTEEAYVDLKLADEEKNAGNEAFKAADYPKAVAHYTEALKRGPPAKWDEAYKVFSNRAACYTKLGALPDGAPLCAACTLRAFNMFSNRTVCYTRLCALPGGATRASFDASGPMMLALPPMLLCAAVRVRFSAHPFLLRCACWAQGPLHLAILPCPLHIAAHLCLMSAMAPQHTSSTLLGLAHFCKLVRIQSRISAA